MYQLHRPTRKKRITVKRMNELQNIKIHDNAMEPWLGEGEVLHIWRTWNDGYLVSYYVTLWRTERRTSLDLARIFGPNPSGPSIDQRIDIYGKDEPTSFRHKRVQVGTE